MFDLDRIQRETKLGFLDFHDSIGSTNDQSKLILSSSDSVDFPFLVLTADQTKGRGQREHQWWSSEDSLTFSWVTDFDISHHNKLALAPLVTALATLEAIESSTSLNEIRIKWPNDLLVNDKKLAGILIEKSNQGCIFGIGINVNQTAFPKLDNNKSDLHPTSVFAETNTKQSPQDILVAIINSLQMEIESLTDSSFVSETSKTGFKTNTKNIIQRCNQRLAYLESAISLQHANGKTIVGTCKGIGPNGGIKIQTGNETREFLSGSIRAV
jgi:biotin-[acetyl-CoA-carboxylase] ligase BirA-like protein